MRVRHVLLFFTICWTVRGSVCPWSVSGLVDDLHEPDPLFLSIALLLHTHTRGSGDGDVLAELALHLRYVPHGVCVMGGMRDESRMLQRWRWQGGYSFFCRPSLGRSEPFIDSSS